MGKFYSGSLRASAGRKAASPAGRLPGSDAKGVMGASDLMQQVDRNRSYRLKGETLVVGSGAVAMQAALAVLDCGSEKVTVVCVQQLEDIPAGPDELAETKQAGARIICGWAPMRIAVHTDGRVSGAFFKHCDRAYDDQGRFWPQYDEDNVMAQYCDNLILADD